MQNSSDLHDRFQAFIRDFAQDHDVTLIGHQTEERDFEEVPYGHNSFHTINFTRTTFHATGFVWQHPHGSSISGQFAQPVKAHEVIETDGGGFDSDHFSADVRKAIVAKCGRISGFADSCLN